MNASLPRHERPGGEAATAGQLAARLAQWQIWIAVVACLVLTTLALLPFTAKPISWDDLAYMGLAFHPEPNPTVLNRYTHIYGLKLFMWVSGDPYTGTRWFWSCLIGATAAILVRTGLALPVAERAPALILTALLWLGQDQLFAYPGIAYADYSVMAIVAASAGPLLMRALAGQEITPRGAMVLGLLFLCGMKAKETALPLLVLPATFFITASGAVRFDRSTRNLGLAWLGGVLLGLVAMMLLDGIFLDDALFGLRRSNWRRLLAFNSRPGVGDPNYTEMNWMLRPANYAALALYAGAGLVWSTKRQDARVTLVYLLPALILLMLGVLRLCGYAVFESRYTIPALPVICFLSAMALVRSAHVVLAHDERRFRTVWWCSVVAAAVFALATGAHQAAPVLPSAAADPFALDLAAPLILVALVALLLFDTWPVMAVGVVLGATIVAAVAPISHVVTRLATHEVQRRGAERFAGFYEVARSVRVEPDAVVFVSDDLYDGSVRRPLVPALTRLNFGMPFATAHIQGGSRPGANADYAVVSFTEYQSWLAQSAGDRYDAIVSGDQQVVLICLRRDCPRRPLRISSFGAEWQALHAAVSLW